VLAALAAAALAVAPAGVETVGCAQQSKASFPHAFSSPASVVVGPLAFVGLRDMRNTTPANIARFHGWKSPALVRPGHTVTVSVDRQARSFARLRYSHVAQRPFARLPHTVRFVGCDSRRAMSQVDGRPVTFYSGFFQLRGAPACVPVTIRADGGAARHRRLSVAGGACGGSMGA
jgi:hypothetical protein